MIILAGATFNQAPREGGLGLPPSARVSSNGRFPTRLIPAIGLPETPTGRCDRRRVSGRGIEIYGPSGISYEANMALNGAPNFPSRLLSNFRSCDTRNLHHRRRTPESFDRRLAGVFANQSADPLTGARGCMHFLHQSVACAGCPKWASSKNSPDGRSAFIPVGHARASGGSERIDAT